MITKEPKTKSKEKRKKESESNYYSKSPEEDKPRTSASFSRTASKSTNLAFTTTWLNMTAAISEMPIMNSTKDLEISIIKMVLI